MGQLNLQALLRVHTMKKGLSELGVGPGHEVKFCISWSNLAEEILKKEDIVSE
jgi:hypothetical protein